MNLVSLHLQNIGVFEELKLEFEPGLVGIFGPQGSGKTTTMNTVYALLTNDFSRLVLNRKEEAVRQQAESHAVSRAEIRAVHNGTEFRLSRTLAPSTRSRLELPGGVVRTKETEVRTELDNLLGSSRQLLGKYVFVDQWRLRELFQQTKSARSEAMAHLCGTDFLGKLYDAVNTRLNVDTRLLTESVMDVDQLRRELGEQRQRAAEYAARHEELQRQQLSDEQAQALQFSVDEYERVLAVMRNLPRKRSLLESHHSSLQSCLKNVAAQQEAISQQMEAVESFRREMDQLQSLEEQYRLRHREYLRRQQLISQIEDLEVRVSSPPPPRPAVEGLDVLEKLLEDLRREMGPHEAIVRSLGKISGKAVCETCGQSLDNLQSRLSKARQSLKPLQARQEELQQAIKLRQVYEKRKLEHDLAVKEAKQSLSTQRAELAELPEVELPAEPEPARTSAARQRHETARRQLAAAQKDHTESVRVSGEHQARVAALEAEIAADESKIRVETITATEYEEMSAMLTASRQVAFEVREAAARLDEVQQEISRREAAIRRCETLQARRESLVRWLDHLGRAKTVFHADGLPRVFHRRVLEQMESQVNQVLEEFESPFSVRTAEELSYNAMFRNGTFVPVQRLSGGQQVVLALAFRWVLNSLFASRIGMLVLDEPTAGLDAHHIALLEVALVRLGAAARSAGCQVIIITHDTRLERVFDQIIRFDRAVV